MKKNVTQSWSIVTIVLLVMFNIVFFIITNGDSKMEESCTTKWVSYLFIHVGFLSMLLTPKFVTRGKTENDTSPVLFGLTTTYLIIELLLGMLFIFLTSPTIKATFIDPVMQTAMSRFWSFNFRLVTTVLNSDPNRLGISLQVILFAIYVIALVIIRNVDKDTEEKEIRHEKELQYVKTAEGQLRFKLNEISDKNTARKVEQLLDYVRTSPLKSCADVNSLEVRILDNVYQIVAENDNETIAKLSEETLRLAQQRNRELTLKNREL